MWMGLTCDCTLGRGFRSAGHSIHCGLPNGQWCDRGRRAFIRHECHANPSRRNRERKLFSLLDRLLNQYAGLWELT